MQNARTRKLKVTIAVAGAVAFAALGLPQSANAATAPGFRCAPYTQTFSLPLNVTVKYTYTGLVGGKYRYSVRETQAGGGTYVYGYSCNAPL